MEGRGQLAAILQPLTVADSFAAIGIPTAVAFFVAKGIDYFPIQRLALIMASLTSAIVFVLLSLYSPFVSKSQDIDQWLLLLVWASIIPGALLAVRRSVWAGQKSWKLMDTARTAIALSRLSAIVLLAAVGVSSVLVFAASPIIAGLCVSTYLLWRRRPTHVFGIGNRTRQREFYRFSLFAALGTVSSAASARLDQAILPALTSSTELGLYAVAVTISEVPLIVGIVLARNLVSEASSGAKTATMLRLVAKGFTLSAVGAIGLAIVSVWALPVVFGSSFDGSLEPLFILLGATVLIVGSVSISAVLTGWHNPLLASLPQVAAILVVVILYSAVGTRATAISASWITMASQGVGLAVAVFVFARLSRRPRPSQDG